ncbi:hypothetical protein AK830_g12622 [Neonectria ditissima]|uniref:Uncharacterized protein n=1 Tax=Neonectria ditissima TaxID=78410 RepID=A0A0P7B038_9HYPO|nr:hypothetical protein AK830_g12622 [Neonectria ditissima]
MDCLQGIDSSRPSPRPTGSSEPSRRGSSISLEDTTAASKEKLSRQTHRLSGGDLIQTPYNSAKSPLLILDPEELRFTNKVRDSSPEDGCPRLSSEPSLPSTPSVTNRLEVYLQDEDKYEMRMMGLQAVPPGESASSAQHVSSNNPSVGLSDSSSWQIVDNVGPDLASTPCTPTRQQISGKGRRTEDAITSHRPTTPQGKNFERPYNLIGITPDPNPSACNTLPKRPDSSISELSLSAGPPVKRHCGPIEQGNEDEDDSPKLAVVSYEFQGES